MFLGSRTSRTVSTVAAMAVVAALAGTSVPASAAEKDGLTPGIRTTQKKLDGSRFSGLPRGMDGPRGAAGEPGRSGLPAGVPSKGSYGFLLKLSPRTTASAYKGALGRGKSEARSAARSQLSAVRSAQDKAISKLPAKSSVLYRSHAALAGVAVRTDVKNYARLRAISGVVAVYPIAPKTPSNSSAVPLQGAPAAWQAHANLGEDSTIAVIDTGIDYTHADFGGPGTTEAYDASEALKGQPAGGASFPNAKVIGGYDLAGDDYTGYNTPVPDPWPLDCQGHGSHVSGSAAGFGVKSDGSTYDGAYDETTPFDSLRIGPGVAPQAKLYGLRVFGCDGSTDLVGAAIDRALDPNGDGDTSDHADVVNMSLGSDFGSPQDADSIITNEAAALGVTMVVSQGNAGDVNDVGGSPGNAPRALTVAASQDNYAQVDTLKITAPGSIAGKYAASRSFAYDWSDQPAGDVTGEVVRVEQPGNLDGCDPLNASDKAAVNGHVAFVEWDNTDDTRRCGSVGRSNNLVAAGATGFVFASDSEPFVTAITGSDKIPGVLLAKGGADKMRDALMADETVTVGGTTANDFRQVVPGLNDTIADFTSRGSGDAGSVKPDLTAVGGTVFSAANGTGNDGTSNSGTSMAAPMVAGAAALVTTQHPDWTVEQTKANLMNTAGQDLFTGTNHTGDKYAPARVGSGRMQVDSALDSEVLAFVTDNPGSVSASFGPLSVTEPVSLTKTIKVQNTGLRTKTFDVGYESRTEIPGATYSVSPSSVTVGPRSSKDVTVTLDVEPSELTKTIDPTMSRDQAGLPRTYEADASGLVTFDSDDSPSLRVPVYAAPRPASEMTQQAAITMSDSGVEEALLPLTGQKVDQGSAEEKIQSTVAGFELQATSGKAPSCSSTVLTDCVDYEDQRAGDLKYVGTTSSAPQVVENGEDPLASPNSLAYFAISTHGRWRTAASSHEFDIYLDGDGDGVADAVTYTTRYADGADVFVSVTLDLNTGDLLDIELINDAFGDTDTALLDSDTMVVPVAIGAIPGVSEGQSRINYAIQAYAYKDEPVDTIGTVTPEGVMTDSLSFDVLNPGVVLHGTYTGDASPLLYPDSPSAVLKLRRDAEAYQADAGLGAMIVHFHNKLGDKAQIVKFRSAPTVALALSPSRAARGQEVTGTVTVDPGTNGPATGEVTLKQGDTTLATGEVVDGSASMSFTMNEAGTFPIHAEYAGDEGHQAATSDPVNLTVEKSRSRVSLSVTPNPARHGRRVRATVRVSTQAGVAPTGRVVVRVNGRNAGRKDLSNGVARIRFSAGRKGRKNVRAFYVGDRNYQAASSDRVRLRVR